MAIQDKFDSAFTDKLLKKTLMSAGNVKQADATNDNTHELTKSNLVTLSNSFTSLQNAFNKIHAHTLNVRNLHQYDEKRISNISRQNSLENKITPGGGTPVTATTGPGNSLASTAATLDNLASSVEKLNDKMKNINLSGTGYSTADLAGDAASTRSRSRMARVGGRALGVAGVGLDVYGRHQEGQSAGQIAAGTGSGLAGAWLGAKGGAAAGAAIGAFFFGAGAVPGAAIGGFLGGIGGYFAGSYAGDTAYDTLNARAMGGGVKAGGTYLVGERGPEVLMLGGLSGRVIANGQRGRTPQSEKYLMAAADQSSRAATKVIKGQPPGPTSYSSKFSNYLGSLFGNMPNWLNRIKDWLGIGPDGGGGGGDYLGGEYSELTADDVATSARGQNKSGASDWRTDTAFIAELNRVGLEYDIDPRALLGLIASESGFDPGAENDAKTTYGLFQFTGPGAGGHDISASSPLRRMNRAQQLRYAADYYFKNANLPAGATAGMLYATIFAPSIAKRIGYDRNTPLYSEGDDRYAANANRTPGHRLYPGLDINSDGAITIADLDARILGKIRSFNLPRTSTRSSSGFVSPVRAGFRAGSAFGERRGDSNHYGVDIPMPVGSSVYAVKEGTIRSAGSRSGWGYTIEIDHDDGSHTLYGHLSEFVRTSGRVSAGQLIALSGGEPGAPGAGRSTGPHLHLELRLNGHRSPRVDPTQYIPGLREQRDQATRTQGRPAVNLPAGFRRSDEMRQGKLVDMVVTRNNIAFPASARRPADVANFSSQTPETQSQMLDYFNMNS